MAIGKNFLKYLIRYHNNMGGALNSKIWNLPTKRVGQHEYLEVISAITAMVREFAPSIKFRPLQCFSDKSSHGDVDFLVEIKQDEAIDWRPFLKKLSGYEPHKNGFTISVPYNGFQCDFNFVSEDSYEIAYIYHSYETGMLMGIVANAMGLSYGHRGLYLQLPLSYLKEGYPEHQYREILISRDPAVIFDILGFNLAWFKQGFANFEEMSRWVAASGFFSPQLFAFDALNSINKARNRKRPVYAAFVEWCVSWPAQAEIRKDEIRVMLLKAFPHIPAEIKVIRAELVRDEERRAKFNGNQVRELLGLEDKALGDFIKEFKKAHVVNGSFEEWLDAHSGEEVLQEIIARHK